MEERKYAAVLYPETKQIGCVLLQAIYGGESIVASLFFDSAQWAVAPPQGVKPTMVRGTEAQWKKLASDWSGVNDGTRTRLNRLHKPTPRPLRHRPPQTSMQ